VLFWQGKPGSERGPEGKAGAGWTQLSQLKRILASSEELAGRAVRWDFAAAKSTAQNSPPVAAAIGPQRLKRGELAQALCWRDRPGAARSGQGKAQAE